MQTLSKDEFDVKKDILLIKIKQGALFIHPTDTIYGIGCNAKNNDAVSKIREIKKQHTSPFSIIAPSKDWIIENCEIKDEHKIWLDKLPGPYTLILRLRNKEAIAANVNLNIDTVGIRIPDHWFSKVVEKLNVPIITTSANVHNEDVMTSEDDLDSEIASKIDFLIYEGEKKGHPSNLIDLTGHEKIIER